MAQQAALGAEIEDIAAVDQRGDDEDRQAAPRRVVYEPCRSLLPDDRRLWQVALVGVVPVSFEAAQKGVGSTA